MSIEGPETKYNLNRRNLGKQVALWGKAAKALILRK